MKIEKSFTGKYAFRSMISLPDQRPIDTTVETGWLTIDYEVTKNIYDKEIVIDVITLERVAFRYVILIDHNNFITFVFD